jgi:hypothetical protein
MPAMVSNLPALTSSSAFRQLTTVQVVHVVLRAPDSIGGLPSMVAAPRQLGVDRVEERVAVADQLAGVGEVLGVRRELDRERRLLVDPPLAAIELPEDRGAAVLGLVLLGVGASRRRAASGYWVVSMT